MCNCKIGHFMLAFWEEKIAMRFLMTHMDSTQTDPIQVHLLNLQL